MITYKAKECRCWREYPNPMEKKSDGQWKCIDCYELVRNGNWRTRKTICKLKEVNADEIPTIRYDITEVIVPEECETGEVRANDK